MHESIFIGELSYLANRSVLVLYNFTSGVNEVINILSYFYLGIIIYKSEYYLFIYFYKKHQFGLFECAKMPWYVQGSSEPCSKMLQPAVLSYYRTNAAFWLVAKTLSFANWCEGR